MDGVHDQPFDIDSSVQADGAVGLVQELLHHERREEIPVLERKRSDGSQRGCWRVICSIEQCRHVWWAELSMAEKTRPVFDADVGQREQEGYL